MLKYLRKHRVSVFIAVILLLAIFALSIYAIYTSSTYQQCQCKYSNYATSQEQQKGTAIIKCLGIFIDSNQGAITAVSTVFIAIFTVILAWATTMLTRLATSQEITSKAIERPYIFVEFILQGVLQPISTRIHNDFKIKLWNYGKTPAEIVMIRAYPVIQAIAPTALTEFEGSERKLPPGLGIAPSLWYDIEIPLDIDDGQLRDIQDWNRKLFCVGKIIYRDMFGEEHETGFCWHLLIHSSITPHFIPTDGSKLNYRT